MNVLKAISRYIFKVLPIVFIMGTLAKPVFSFQPASNIENVDHGGTDWVITVDTVAAGRHINLGHFKIDPGVSVFVYPSTLTVAPWEGARFGTLEIYANTITIDGELNGDGKGYQGVVFGPGRGPGGGTRGAPNSTCGSGGGANGGNGGGGFGSAGGIKYGEPGLLTAPPSADDMYPGSSGGGWRNNAPCGSQLSGAGGAAILLQASTGTINKISSNGISSRDHPTGHGAGGTIILDISNLIADTVVSSGASTVSFGRGGPGGGGRIKFFNYSAAISTFNVNGGLSGESGAGNPENGSIHFNMKPSLPLLLTPPNSSGAGLLPSFDWSDSLDLDGPDDNNDSGDGTTVLYDFQLSTSTDFVSLHSGVISSESSFVSSNSLNVTKTYYWRVRVYDGSSYTEWTDAWTVFADLIPPTGHGISTISPFISSVTVGLNIPVDSISNIHAQPYWTEASLNQDFTSIAAFSSWITSNEWQASGLSPDTNYWFRTKARDAALNETPWSPTESVKTQTTRPDFVAVDFIGSTSVQVSWGAGINPADAEYSAQISDESSFPGLSTTISIVSALNHTFTGLKPNKTYYIRIANKDWTAFASEFVNTNLVTLPNPVDPNTFSNVTQSAINSRWGSNVNPQGTEYLVEVSSTGGIIAQSPWQIDSAFNFTELNPNVLYNFRTKARNSVLSEGGFISLGSTATLASQPPKPVVMADFDNTLGNHYRIIAEFGLNSADTELAIKRFGSQEFVQGDGTLDTNEVWKTKAEWASGFITNTVLNPDLLSMSFSVTARNFQGLKSAESVSSGAGLPPEKPGAPSVEAVDGFLVVSGYSPASRAVLFNIYHSELPSAPMSSLTLTTTTKLSSYHDDVPCPLPSSPEITSPAVFPNSVTLFWTSSIAPSCGPRYYRVAGVDADGQEGEKSEVGGDNNTLNPTIDSYDILRDNIIIGSTTAPGFIDKNLTQNTTYVYSIVARTSKGVLSANSTPVNIWIPISGLAITEREIHDTDNNGQGDTVKLFFNQNVIDSTVIASDFTVGGNSGLSLLTNIPGDNANDTVLHIWVENQFKSDATPLVKYNGSTIQSDLNQMLVDAVEVIAKDKVAPSIEALTVVSFSGKAVIHIKFSENVKEASVNGLSLWQVEAPLGSPMSLIPAAPNFDQNTFSLSFLNEISATSLKVAASNVEDTPGNIRASVEETTTNILRQPYTYTIEKGFQDWKAEGPAVHSSAEVVLLFDREMNRDSLQVQSAIAVYLIQNSFGRFSTVSQDSLVEGKVNVDPDNRTVRFSPTLRLAKGSRFRVIVSGAIEDAFEISAGADSSWDFATAIHHAALQDSITNPIPEFQVLVSPGAFDQDAGIFMVIDPAANAQYTSRNLIFRAQQLEFTKANQTGSSTHFPIPALTFEIVGQTPSGEIIQGSLGRNVDISVSYPDVDNNDILDFTNPGVPVKDLAFYFLDESIGEFRKIPSVVDRGIKTITASINHFSVYAVMGSLLTSVQSFQVRPNPWIVSKDPKPVILDNLPEDARIAVYNLLGQKVNTLNGNGASSMSWNGTNHTGQRLASGVYMLRLEGAGESKTAKLTIIR